MHNLQITPGMATEFWATEPKYSTSTIVQVDRNHCEYLYNFIQYSTINVQAMIRRNQPILLNYAPCLINRLGSFAFSEPSSKTTGPK